ncbi:ImmA/IrrE family metallo-endopeptidase [Bifidobacterium thermophilum]|uniref:ImmA/IrrE family metallo-endopeptidase n=1 Tax=Bifidobacterium thermophilum TaxID=33905 RepID=UPI003992877A
MSTTAQVSVPASIWKWVTTIGSTRKLSPEDHRHIDRWMSGNATPTVNQLIKLSNKLEVPFGYFFLAKPIDDTPEIFAHRTLRNSAISRPSRNLLDTLDSMQSVQDWMRQDAIDHGDTPIPFVGSWHLQHADAMELASAIREQLDLTTTWYCQNGHSLPADKAFNTLRKLCTDAGIIVMLNGIVGDNTHRPLDPYEFRAFALVDEYAPLIFINRADSINGQIFSLAHEIAHIWLGKEEIYNAEYQQTDNAPIEVLCNAVAAELLVPQQEFSRQWQTAQAQGDTDYTAIDRLSQAFPASQVVIARRALDGRLIPQDVYNRVCAESAEQWEKNRKTSSNTSGGNYYSTKQSRLDHRFIEHLAASISEGQTSYTDAYRLTGTNRKTFPKLLETIGA